MLPASGTPSPASRGKPALPRTPAVALVALILLAAPAAAESSAESLPPLADFISSDYHGDDPVATMLAGGTTVGELKEVSQDMGYVRGWWKNRLLRIFLVFLLTTLGSGIGTWVGGAEIVSNLF